MNEEIYLLGGLLTSKLTEYNYIEEVIAYNNELKVHPYRHFYLESYQR